MDKRIYCPYCNELVDPNKDKIGPESYECPNCGEIVEVRKVKPSTRD